MEKKVLVPTNFSKHAWNALVYGLNLYRDIPCTFFILNTYEASNRLSFPKTKKGESEDAKLESEKGLQKILQGLNFRKENLQHKFEVISSKKDLTKAIQETVDQHNIDLVLMAAHGAKVSINTAFENEISEVTDVIQNCSFLILPENLTNAPTEKPEIVFPTNYKFAIKNKEVTPLRELAVSLNAAIRVLYIEDSRKSLSETQEKNKESLKAYFPGIALSFHQLSQTTLTTGIHLFIESRESSFLALFKRKKGFFSKLFSQQFTEEIDFNPTVPVLILKEME
ncbi:Universal stress protein family protein [Salegentibacter echinorum]|uniref:Universal stress protein family protein n=1 Tax=Salegentibacter echinorum TaxID=1073325 RepID=A0A1M5M3K1_SALEC|nr:universal stress protein [Salegentibacter echinorum]SHG71293.1 Universal stress protein family protein [Salegentibacter echinorum]